MPSHVPSDNVGGQLMCIYYCDTMLSIIPHVPLTINRIPLACSRMPRVVFVVKLNSKKFPFEYGCILLGNEI